MMDAADYAVEWVPGGSGWRITNAASGITGWVSTDRGKFRAQVMVNGRWVLIWSGSGLKSAVEQVIWYDRAMNQEGE